MVYSSSQGDYKHIASLEQVGGSAALAFAPDSKVLYSGAYNRNKEETHKTLQSWCIEDDTFTPHLLVGNESVSCLNCTSDGTIVAGGFSNDFIPTGIVATWSPSGELKQRLDVGDDAFTTTSVSPDGSHVIVGCYDGLKLVPLSQ